MSCAILTCSKRLKESSDQSMDLHSYVEFKRNYRWIGGLGSRWSFIGICIAATMCKTLFMVWYGRSEVS